MTKVGFLLRKAVSSSSALVLMTFKHFTIFYKKSFIYHLNVMDLITNMCHRKLWKELQKYRTYTI